MIQTEEKDTRTEMRGNGRVILASCDFIPRPILERLGEAGLKEEDLILAAEADLSPQGEVVPVWVLAGKDLLAAVPAVKEIPLSGPYRFSEVKDFDLRATIGSTSLRAQVDGTNVELVRFTNEYRERFQRVLTQLKRLRAGESLQEEALLLPDPKVCARCGLVLPIEKAPCPRCIKQKAILGRMLSMLAPYSWWVVLLLGMMVAGIAFDMLPPFLTRVLVDDVLTTREHMEWLLFLVMGLAGASLCRGLVNIGIGRLSSRIGTKMTFDVRKQLFDKLQQMSLDYYDRMQIGSLLTRVVSDVEVFHGFVAQAAQGFLVNVLLILAIGGMLFYLNPHLAVFVLIPIPFVVGGTLFFWKRIYPRYFKFWDSHSKLASMLNGVLSGVRLVKAFGQEQRETERFHLSNAYLSNTRYEVDKRAGTFHPILAYIFGLGGLIVWLVGGRDVLADKITLGTLIAYFAYIGMFYAPLSSLALFSNWVTQFMSASQRVFEILDMHPAIQDSRSAKVLEEVRGEVEFKDVTFGYDPYHAVIKGVSFKIRPGENIGIVGKSGSGKSTLINLLCRFYDVQKGDVLVDGVDVREVQSASLRRHVGLVLQEPFLFRASVAENIAYGRPEASIKEIVAASKAANCHDFIMRLAAGYDTRLGERGAGLSGGERQRISIARAILCDPAILILDEATSNVDTEAEQEIQKALQVLCRGRTAIIIAHRLSTLKNADRIYVVDSGRIVESGSHTELMAAKGIYYRLVKIQTELTSVSTGEG